VKTELRQEWNLIQQPTPLHIADKLVKTNY
jgi:hypothetical protein